MRTIGILIVYLISFVFAIWIIRHSVVWLGIVETTDWIEQGSVIAIILFYVIAMILGSTIGAAASMFLEKLDQAFFKDNNDKNF